VIAAVTFAQDLQAAVPLVVPVCAQSAALRRVFSFMEQEEGKEGMRVRKWQVRPSECQHRRGGEAVAHSAGMYVCVRIKGGSGACKRRARGAAPRAASRNGETQRPAPPRHAPPRAARSTRGITRNGMRCCACARSTASTMQTRARTRVQVQEVAVGRVAAGKKAHVACMLLRAA